MDNALRELIEEYKAAPDRVRNTVIIPMATVFICFVGGLLIGATFV